MTVNTSKDQIQNKRVAVVGSGLAGLSTAYMLQESGKYTVTLFERESQVGMDAGSLTFEGVRIDVPFRVFNPDYYPYLCRMYTHLGITLSKADYSLAFTRDNCAETVWSYTNTSVGDFQVPIPDNTIHNVECTRDWVRILLLCVRAVRSPKMLLDAELASVSIGEYLHAHGYASSFTDLIFVPFLASLFTCSLDAAAAYPANSVVHFVAKAVFGARLRKASRGVQQVCELLTQVIPDIRLASPVERVDPNPDGTVTVVVAGKSLVFDAVVMATPADITANILASSTIYPTSDLLAALRSVPYETAVVTTHSDQRVMSYNRDEWRGVNIGTDFECPHAMASHWINYVEETSTRRTLSRDLFQTVNPISPLDRSLILGETYFHRSLVDVVSQKELNTLHKLQGTSSIWFVGAYTAPGIPLLEGCVRTAVDVARALGADPKFDAPRVSRTDPADSNNRYEVGLAPGMRRGEIVEAYFECDVANTLKPELPILKVIWNTSNNDVQVPSWASWLAWVFIMCIMPVADLVGTIIGFTFRIILGQDITRSIALIFADAIILLLLVIKQLVCWIAAPSGVGTSRIMAKAMKE